MTTKKNKKAIYVIAVIAIVVAFFLLGGGTWIKGLSHGNVSIGLENWNWTQIIISLVIGFILGLLFSKRRR
jgi:TRAP-type C4-dicarboxylate transport system permease small subunit